jgi:hypothetical protein
MPEHHSVQNDIQADRQASVRAGDASLTRRHFIVTAASAAGGLMIGIAAAPRSARAATVEAQPWNDDNA